MTAQARLPLVYGDDDHFQRLGETARAALDQPSPLAQHLPPTDATGPCHACGQRDACPPTCETNRAQ